MIYITDLIETNIIIVSFDIMAWIGEYIYIDLWNIITQRRLNYDE